MNETSFKILSYYRGGIFRWQRWRSLSPDWTHDHCLGCSVRFAERPEQWSDRICTDGWVTLAPVSKASSSEFIDGLQARGYNYVPAPAPGGYHAEWLCAECFEHVRQELGFIVDPDHPQWKQAGL